MKKLQGKFGLFLAFLGFVVIQQRVREHVTCHVLTLAHKKSRTHLGVVIGGITEAFLNGAQFVKHLST